MICPNCGKEIDDNSVFCAYCGKETKDTNTYYQSNNENDSIPKQGNPAKLIFMWIMIIVAVIFMFIALGNDYGNAVRNEENFWYGQYMTAAIFHTLCALFFLKLAQLLNK